MRRVLVVAALAVLVPAAPASAGTLAFQIETFVYSGDGDERNDVTISYGPDRTVVRDEGATVRLADGVFHCRVVDEHQIECAPSTLGLGVATGDGDDRVHVSGRGVAVRLGSGDDTAVAKHDTFLVGDDGDDELTGQLLVGGAGNDRLVLTPAARTMALGDEGDDVLLGSPGRDEIHPGNGTDRVDAGAGDDWLADGETGQSDTYEGGAGSDHISYAAGSAGVTIDLAAGTAGAQGEGDRLSSFEGATGTHLADVLIGGPGPDVLDPGDADDVALGHGGDDTIVETNHFGDDRIEGGDGADTIRSEHGNDRVDGGAGDDVLDGGDGEDVLLGGDGADRIQGGFAFDSLDGGAGDDLLESAGDFVDDAGTCGAGGGTAYADWGERHDGSCDTVIPVPVRSLLPRNRTLSVRGRTVSFTGRCFGPVLAGTVSLRVGEREIARGRWTCTDVAHAGVWETATLRLPLGRRTARRIARRGSLRATAVFELGFRAQLPLHEPVVVRARRRG